MICLLQHPPIILVPSSLFPMLFSRSARGAFGSVCPSFCLFVRVHNLKTLAPIDMICLHNEYSRASVVFKDYPDLDSRL